MTKTLLFGGSGFFGPVILSKDKDILKVSTTKRGGALSGRYEICVWQVRPGALEDN